MHPLLVKIGPLRIGSYGACMAAGFLLGWWLCRRLGTRVASGQFWDALYAYLALFGILGAKLLLVLVFLPDLLAGRRPWSALLFGGGVWLGGVLAGMVTVWWKTRRERVPAAPVLDVLFTVLPFSHALGRLGCFLGDCCYGRPTDVPWAVVYTHPLAARLQGTPLGAPLHPYPLYEMVFELLNFTVCLTVLRRRTVPGAVSATWLALYGVQRFFLEWLRFDPRGSYGLLSTSQWISLAMVAVSAVWFLRHRGPWLRPAQELPG
jgi:phosphatidylglycerol:prolipoprotein diacylglycerol transferase